MKHTRVTTLSRRLVSTLAVLVPMVLIVNVGAAHAVTYSWHDAKTKSGKVLVEPTRSASFARKGIRGKVAKADGYTWETTVWLGDAYTKGADEAALSTSIRTTRRTKARYIFKPDNSVRTHFTAQITGVPSGGMALPASSGAEAVHFELDANELIEAASSGQEASSRTTNASVELLATDGEIRYWRVDAPSGAVYFGLQQGEFIATTATPDRRFETSGLQIEFNDGEASHRAVLVPGEVDPGEVDADGLRVLPGGVLTETHPGAWTTPATVQLADAPLRVAPPA